MDNVLVSGLKVNHTSHSRAVEQSSSVEINKNCPIVEINSCEEQVVSALKYRKIIFQFFIHLKQMNHKLLLNLIMVKQKTSVISSEKYKRHINEHVTHKNTELARLARQ